MKPIVSLFLTLNILCVSLTAMAHNGVVGYLEHDSNHHHVHHESMSSFENDHDPNNHSHVSLELLLDTLAEPVTSLKYAWSLKPNVGYLSKTYAPPQPPPSI